MTDTHPAAQAPYVLGHQRAELARLDHQADVLTLPTRTALLLAGIGPGQRVLDLGTGTGQVARLAAELVGPTGSVVGVDRSPDALQQAAVTLAGLEHVRLVEDDLATYRPTEPFDAVVGRLVHSYLADPVARIRALMAGLRPGGVYLAMEYDIEAMRTAPRVPWVEELLQLVVAAFEAVRTPQNLGPRLGGMLEEAGGAEVRSLGLQTYLGPRDPQGGAMLQGILASLLPAIERHGLATAETLDLDTLPARLSAETRMRDATVVIPTLSAAWARRPDRPV